MENKEKQLCLKISYKTKSIKMLLDVMREKSPADVREIAASVNCAQLMLADMMEQIVLCDLHRSATGLRNPAKTAFHMLSETCEEYFDEYLFTDNFPELNNNSLVDISERLELISNELDEIINLTSEERVSV